MSREAKRPQSSRAVALDGLRGVFAFLVLAYHYVTWSALDVPPKFYEFLDRSSVFAVCGFFSISAASMALAYSRRPPFSLRTFRAFLTVRFFRLAPLFYAVLALSIAVRAYECMRDACEPALLEKIALNVTFLFGLAAPGKTSLVVAGWSIGIEWVFYALFPLLFAIALRSRWLAVALLAASTALLWLWNVDYSQSGYPGWLDYAHFPAYLFYFAAGLLVGILRANGSIKGSDRMWWTLFAAAAAFYVLVGVPTGFRLRFDLVTTVSWASALAVVTMVAAACYVDRPPPRLSAGMRRAGDYSYSLYLLHFPVFMATSVLNLPAPVTVGIALVGSVASAIVVYHVYEFPLLRFGRNLSKRIIARGSDARTPAVTPEQGEQQRPGTKPLNGQAE